MANLTKKSFLLGKNSLLDRQQGLIDPEFEKKLLSHIVGNYLDNSPFPLFLAIHGKKGEGKTFQTIRTCSKYQFNMYYISAAQLCGSYEKDSISDLEENYEEAIFNYKTSKILSVLIIDDFHLSIASAEAGVGKTINSQVLTGYLMNLADKAKAQKNSRVPIVLLGNDFKFLYDPLTRDGRLDFFEWNPSIKVKAAIISSIFEDMDGLKDHAEFKQFVLKNIEHPISFFAEIKNDIQKALVSRIIENDSKKNISLLINELNNKQSIIHKINMKILAEFAEKREASHILSIHEDRRGLNNE
jgi:hypothetical protein